MNAIFWPDRAYSEQALALQADVNALRETLALVEQLLRRMEARPLSAPDDVWDALYKWRTALERDLDGAEQRLWRELGALRSVFDLDERR